MESGAFSDPEFPTFSAKVIPFLHLTTKIEGHPYDDLLAQNGGYGFPTLLFLDADGGKLGSPTDRAVVSFEASLDAISRIDAVRAKAESGDAAATTELLFLEYALGKLPAEKFRERAAALTEVTDAQRARIDQIMVDNRIWELVGERDPEVQARGMLAILEEGKRPSLAPKYVINFWSILGRWGQSQGDAALLRRVVAGMREDLARDQSMLRWADSLEKAAKGLERRDALRKRLVDGEQGLEPEILLLELELRAIDLDGFRAALPAALAAADDAQKEELLQGEVDLEFETLWREASTREPGSENHGKRMLEMMFADGRKPSERLLRQGGLSIAARWVDTNLSDVDSGMLRELAALIRKSYTHKFYADMAERFEDELAKRERSDG